MPGSPHVRPTRRAGRNRQLHGEHSAGRLTIV